MQYIVPILALFQGRLIENLEEPMVKTEYSSGGEVEHEVGTLFNVVGSDTDNLVDLLGWWCPVLCHGV